MGVIYSILTTRNNNKKTTHRFINGAGVPHIKGRMRSSPRRSVAGSTAGSDVRSVRRGEERRLGDMSITIGFKALSMKGMVVSSFEGLGTQTELEYVYLQRNHLRNFQFLGCQPNMRELRVQHNNITSLAGLVRQPKCEYVGVECNPIAKKEHHRVMLLAVIGQSLKKIDGVPVTYSERCIAKQLPETAVYAISCGWILDLKRRDASEYLEEADRARHLHGLSAGQPPVAAPYGWRRDANRSGGGVDASSVTPSSRHVSPSAYGAAISGYPSVSPEARRHADDAAAPPLPEAEGAGGGEREGVAGGGAENPVLTSLLNDEDESSRATSPAGGGGALHRATSPPGAHRPAAAASRGGGGGGVPERGRRGWQQGYASGGTATSAFEPSAEAASLASLGSVQQLRMQLQEAKNELMKEKLRNKGRGRDASFEQGGGGGSGGGADPGRLGPPSGEALRSMNRNAVVTYEEFPDVAEVSFGHGIRVRSTMQKIQDVPAAFVTVDLTHISFAHFFNRTRLCEVSLNCITELKLDFAGKILFFRCRPGPQVRLGPSSDTVSEEMAEICVDSESKLLTLYKVLHFRLGRVPDSDVLNELADAVASRHAEQEEEHRRRRSASPSKEVRRTVTPADPPVLDAAAAASAAKPFAQPTAAESAAESESGRGSESRPGSRPGSNPYFQGSTESASRALEKQKAYEKKGEERRDRERAEAEVSQTSRKRTPQPTNGYDSDQGVDAFIYNHKADDDDEDEDDVQIGGGGNNSPTSASVADVPPARRMDTPAGDGDDAELAALIRRPSGGPPAASGAHAETETPKPPSRAAEAASEASVEGMFVRVGINETQRCYLDHRNHTQPLKKCTTIRCMPRWRGCWGRTQMTRIRTEPTKNQKRSVQSKNLPYNRNKNQRTTYYSHTLLDVFETAFKQDES